MKTKLKTLLLLPFFALLMFTSCQDEVIDITPPDENEEVTLTASSELTSLMFYTSAKDGSADNIIDKASCTSVELPVTVIVNGLEITIDSEEDFKVIEAIFNEFEDDEDELDIVFPITIILSNHEEIVIENRDQLEELIQQCKDENEEDDDIECIDFKYPISFTVYNTDFQIIDVITVENDRELYHFIKRIKEETGLLASINFPVTMVLADGSEIEVNNNIELANIIKEAKDACDEDDDNDYGDDDFTKEHLDELLMTCPWVVYEFERNEDDLNEVYRDYVMVFKEEGVVKVYARGGDILTGTWSTRVTTNGALIKLEFDTLVDFTLEWFVYDLAPGKIKLYQEGGNKIILKKNCDLALDITKERIESYLQECFWRVARLKIDGADNEIDYIGTPLKFFPDNVVKLRVNGEFVQGTYQIAEYNTEGFVLQIQLEGRPNLQLEWLITFLQPELIKLENLGNRDDEMILHRHCVDVDGDLTYIDGVLITGEWEVALYQDGDENKTENYFMYTVDFQITGRVKITDPNFSEFSGSWLAYRNEGLYLGLYFNDYVPFDTLNHRWKIVEVTANRIELRDFSSTGEVERILVLEKEE
ncbi:hypothetical protein MBM09_04630 [Flaviramulus sp. BrNp1-15]|uniref:hypothetical protein n=1 Tax=Flaviramulus sp. BrNp1-15 TaxID=2916754 RepID=UPI001EE84BBA|nr:hypothetical protein [Flaviramulus sp. BrNp1-15]ULC60277.1 hypothetical protein MBM09_04630 [Flaviramulus sp. BrNp1-15]